jgi:hypothetical protein
MIKRELPVYTVPALDHDAMMAREFGHKLTPRHRIERRIVAALCAYLESNAFEVIAVDSGDERVKVNSAKAAMEEIFNLDESRVVFERVDKDIKTSRHTVLIILGNGNDGLDLISDWSYSEGDADGFGAAMDWFIGPGLESIEAIL